MQIATLNQWQNDRGCRRRRTLGMSVLSNHRNRNRHRNRRRRCRRVLYAVKAIWGGWPPVKVLMPDYL
eukprot:SAG31_NODE_1750_length_7353_cov_17.309209_1_plen_68_part_00